MIRRSKTFTKNSCDIMSLFRRMRTCQAWSQIGWKQALSPIGKKEQDEPTSILNLPLEIIIFILEHIPLHSCCFLSQTCRLMWTTLRPLCNADKDKLYGTERTPFLAWIAFATPSIWPCEACDGYHPIDVRNYPSTDVSSYSACPQHGCRLGTLNYGLGYELNQAHINFALKLARFDRLHRQYSEYAEKLVAPFQRSVCWDGATVIKYRA